MLWKGILLGLGAAAPIGPVNVEIARRALRGGFRPAFLLGCGAVTIDVAYAILVSFGLRPLLGRDWAMAGLGILGAGLLGFMAVGCLRSAYRRQYGDVETVSSGLAVHHYLTGLAMTSLNPMTLVFWFVAVPTIAGQLSAKPGADLPWICAGVFCGAFSWVCFFGSLMAVVGRRARRRAMISADIAGGMMLLAFAVAAIWRVASIYL